MLSKIKFGDRVMTSCGLATALDLHKYYERDCFGITSSSYYMRAVRLDCNGVLIQLLEEFISLENK